MASRAASVSARSCMPVFYLKFLLTLERNLSLINTVGIHRNQGASMRKFSVRPAITLRGRKWKGLRGLAGKPFHPPLTDIPIGAYVLGAAFDVISVAGGNGHAWAREMWHAGTYAFIGGAIVS